ncbi:MAG: SRPBCC family protein [Henriciella sp.]|nr:SRPBCC family protein [Henriciella sp.]
MGDYATYPENAVLEIYRDLPGPIDRVWDYLTKSELRKKWLCAGVVSNEVGGEIQFQFDHSLLSQHPTPDSHQNSGDQKMTGIVRVYEPPHHLAFSWPSAEAEAPTEVVIKLTETEAGVRLHLRHERVITSDYKSGASAGWHTHLDILGDTLAGGVGRDFWEHFLPLEQEYKAKLAEV